MKKQAKLTAAQAKGELVINNLVAKHAAKFCRCSVQTTKKQKAKMGYRKHRVDF